MKCKKVLLLLLVLAFALSLASRASNANDTTVTGSFEESKIPFPRIVYYSRNSRNISDLYYIPISEEISAMCQDILGEADKEKIDPREYVQLFQLELDKDRKNTVFETLSGNYYIGLGRGMAGVRADKAVEILLSQIEEAAEYPASIDLYDFKEAVCVELVQRKQVIWRSDDKEVIKCMNILLDAYQGSSVSNCDTYDFELRCLLADDRIISFFLSSDDGYIFIPPLRYYKLPQDSVLRTTGWPEIFGLIEWPANSANKEGA